MKKSKEQIEYAKKYEAWYKENRLEGIGATFPPDPPKKRKS